MVSLVTRRGETPPWGFFWGGSCGFWAGVIRALACYFLAEAVEFRLNFFRFGLNLSLDEVAEHFWVDGRFDVESHSGGLCGITIEDGFKFFSHGAFAGKVLMGGDLAGPTFNEEFF